MIYYIDPMHGRDDADGASPAQARRSEVGLTVLPGDTVLFRRGSVVRGELHTVAGTPGAPVRYGAYGEGRRPVFCGSVDVSDPALWHEVRPNVWRCSAPLTTEVCNFIFDGDRCGGTLRWSPEELTEPGDWYDTRMGSAEGQKTDAPGEVLLYSLGNPGTAYTHLECAVWGARTVVRNQSDTELCDLIFFGSGVHAAASGGAARVAFRRCAFLFIGGAVWNLERRIRFGNAIEFWERGEDILIEDCYFDQIYDSCITEQGSEKCEPAKNIVMRRNLFLNYGMAAYEGRDRMTVNCRFEDNVCAFAGGGFSALGDTKPRNSEIYPQPMGHHLFFWRITAPSEGGGFAVEGNVFGRATGAAAYDIIAPEAQSQMTFARNRYAMPHGALLAHLSGTNYSTDSFAAFAAATGETGTCAPGEVDDAIGRWFERHEG